MVSILLHRFFLLLDSLWHWYSLLHFLFLHCNLQLQFLCVYFTIFLLSFSFCSCILFITCLSVFSCSSLNFVKTCILSYLLCKPLICISLQFIASMLLHSSIFHIPWNLSFLTSHLKKQSPEVSTDWLHERDTFLQSC